jgi:hypothetical protein
MFSLTSRTWASTTTARWARCSGKEIVRSALTETETRDGKNDVAVLSDTLAEVLACLTGVECIQIVDPSFGKSLVAFGLRSSPIVMPLFCVLRLSTLTNEAELTQAFPKLRELRIGGGKVGRKLIRDADGEWRD